MWVLAKGLLALKSKLVWGSFAIIIIGIAINTAINSWRDDIQENVALRIGTQQKNALIELQKKEYELLDESHKAMAQEVEWARHYTAKQTETIEQLRTNSSAKVKACLNLEIDSRFVR